MRTLLDSVLISEVSSSQGFRLRIVYYTVCSVQYPLHKLLRGKARWQQIEPMNSLQNLVLMWRLHAYSCFNYTSRPSTSTLMQCNVKMILGTVISTGALVGKNGDPLDPTGWIKEERSLRTNRVQFSS